MTWISISSCAIAFSRALALKKPDKISLMRTVGCVIGSRGPGIKSEHSFEFRANFVLLVMFRFGV